MAKINILIKNNIRIYVADTIDVSRNAIDTQKTSPLPSIVLATAVNVFGTFSALKDGTNTFVNYKVNGPIGQIIVDAKHDGRIRALVGAREIPTDFDKKDVNAIPIRVGLGEKGTLSITESVGEHRFDGSVEMAGGDIVTDLALYLDHSEQIFSAIVSDIHFDDKQTINRSRCAIFQLLPGHTEEDIKWIEEFIKNNKLSTYNNIDSYIEAINGNKLGEKHISWYCEFSHDRAKEVLKTLPKEEAQKIIDEIGFIEIKDDFCNKAYKFEKVDD